MFRRGIIVRADLTTFECLVSRVDSMGRRNTCSRPTPKPFSSYGSYAFHQQRRWGKN
jgi:hypothetical protein